MHFLRFWASAGAQGCTKTATGGQNKLRRFLKWKCNKKLISIMYHTLFNQESGNNFVQPWPVGPMNRFIGKSWGKSLNYSTYWRTIASFINFGWCAGEIRQLTDHFYTLFPTLCKINLLNSNSQTSHRVLWKISWEFHPQSGGWQVVQGRGRVHHEGG